MEPGCVDEQKDLSNGTLTAAPTTKPLSKIEALPNELLLHIIRSLYPFETFSITDDNPGSNYSPFEDAYLMSCTLVCPQFRVIAQQLLAERHRQIGIQAYWGFVHRRYPVLLRGPTIGKRRRLSGVRKKSPQDCRDWAWRYQKSRMLTRRH